MFWSCFYGSQLFKKTILQKCEFEIDPTSLISPCTTQVVVSGNRVFLMTYTDQEELVCSIDSQSINLFVVI